jgi:sugar phosphate isomerase/epimerase
MKLSFSTLACPDWTMSQIVSIAQANGYAGIELRFVENEDSLWKLPSFHGSGLAKTKTLLGDHGLVISCVDTSCRFHSPDPCDRATWIDEGERMAELAAELKARGIRVFGDKIQQGADRYSTRKWIADSIRELQAKINSTGVQVWLETHGDFASASETNSILQCADRSDIGVIWDPANCWTESGETPSEGADQMRMTIRHVHVKDLHLGEAGAWEPVLNGEGTFPLGELRAALNAINYNGFLSYEWEKKWHPNIPDASIALPHFGRWMRENWTS